MAQRSGGGRTHFSKRPFPNARKFRYYDKHGREKFIYGNVMPPKSTKLGFILGIVILSPFLLCGVGMIISLILALLPLKPLMPDYEAPQIHIVDYAGVIDNTNSLEETLQEFEDQTGISPCILTVYDSDWVYSYGYNLSDFAYSMYLEFSDEQHFLIVYSEPQNSEELDFVDWSWEAVQGDETDIILTELNVPFRF